MYLEESQRGFSTMTVKISNWWFHLTKCLFYNNTVSTNFFFSLACMFYCKHLFKNVTHEPTWSHLNNGSVYTLIGYWSVSFSLMVILLPLQNCARAIHETPDSTLRDTWRGGEVGSWKKEATPNAESNVLSHSLQFFLLFIFWARDHNREVFPSFWSTEEQDTKRDSEVFNQAKNPRATGKPIYSEAAFENPRRKEYSVTWN